MEQMTLSQDGYIELKNNIRDKLNETVNNFIIIGYKLKQVRDSYSYRYDGYTSIEEFAKKEYNLSASTSNRFMGINTEFSVGGNSLEIMPEYQGFGYSKLQEMLTVHPEDRELVSENTTVQQIRELKKAETAGKLEAEQEREQPLIQMANNENRQQVQEKVSMVSNPDMDSFEEIMIAFWMEEENRELYKRIAAGILTPEIIAEEISPSGSRTYRKGVNIVFFYDFEKGLKLRSYNGGKTAIILYTYKVLLERIVKLNILPNKNEKEEWKESENLNATPQPEEEEQDTPYVPMPGQLSFQEAEPKTDTENVIEGKYRELDAQITQECTEDEKESSRSHQFTDIEVEYAVNYFETEYTRMVTAGLNTAKQRNYKIAIECIRECYKNIVG